MKRSTRDWRRFAALLTIVLAFAHVDRPAKADPLVERVITAYRQWTLKQHLTQSSLAVLRDGRVLTVDSMGPTSSAKPEPVASVSKSITGVCIVRLVEMGRLRYDASLGELLGDYFDRNGAPTDPRFASITVAHLLNQTSGIGDGNIDGKKIRLYDQMRDTIKLRLIHDPGGAYHYENKNFQVLGLIIESVTRRPYEVACRDLVLKPVGAGAAFISRQQPYMSSWAGWVISAHDLALFARYFDPRLHLLRTGPKDWPKVDRGNRFFYSIGVDMRHNEDDSYSVWHSGVWTWNSKDLKYQFMARYIEWGIGIGFAMNARPSRDGLGHDLEHELWMAAQPQPGDVPREKL